jgi:hypothetical protein
MIIDDIFTGVAAAVVAATPTSDAGGPTAFHAAETVSLEESSEDRVFTIRLTGTGRRNVTGHPGRVDRFMAFDVVAKFINEGRSEIDHSKIMAQDVQRIQDLVPKYFNDGAVSGVGTVDDTEAATWSEGDQPGTWIVTIPFNCEYYDDVTTS